MYRSKDQGYNQITFFSSEMNARVVRRHSLENKLRQADPEEGKISPSEFIPLAEDCGLIGVIDEWVLKSACSKVLQWYGGRTPEISLSVNLSPAQFIRKDLHGIVKQILARELGVEISVDDFGTAYSSLSRLKQLPLNTLKIDQSFVRDLGKDPEDETIVRTIITMAHNLNLKVVAEGVETEVQYNFVKQHGCDAVQGFLFGKPVPAEEMEKRIKGD
jgi:EAL domain-containing protein (putative c-di-GMP-specific phosphodiesterase class I)